MLIMWKYEIYGGIKMMCWRRGIWGGFLGVFIEIGVLSLQPRVSKVSLKASR
jgi:hypothetical protein